MALTAFLSAYLASLYANTWTDRAAIARRQDRLWRRLPLGDYPALRGWAKQPLARFPIVDVADYRAQFQAYNRYGLSLEAATAAALASEAGRPSRLPYGLSAGLSTGTTSATRGLFVTTAEERATYIGTVLAKLVPPAEWSKTKRVALCLRAGNVLYNADLAGMRLRFIPLAPDHDATIQALREDRPDVLVAPPQVLLSLATKAPDFRCPRVYYGAETLNDVERDFITERLGVRPDPIYQATEGFLGAPCRLGTLHLNEDSLIIEREPLDSHGRFRPVITDLRRRTQAVVRLRLDDVLQETTCACGSPLQAVKPLMGRVSDIWRLEDRVIFPDEIQDVVAPLLPGDMRWIAMIDNLGISIACPDDKAAARILKALAGFGGPVKRVPYDPAADFPKRRHVRAVAETR